VNETQRTLHVFERLKKIDITWSKLGLYIQIHECSPAYKIHLRSINKKIRDVTFIISIARSSCLLLDDCDGIAKELSWKNQEFSSVDIIQPRFSMLIYLSPISIDADDLPSFCGIYLYRLI
jgi:hypothetical protein